jgi:rod shape-determining protein MreC
VLKLFSNKKILVLVIGLIVFFAVVGKTYQNRGAISWPEKFLKDTVNWAQSLVYKPIAATGHFFVKIGHMNDIYKENEQLKHTLSTYVMDIAKLNALEQENTRLKTLLDFTAEQKKKVNYTYHVASVIGYGSDTYRKTMDIDLGAREGMKVGMAVVTDKGLLGRIIRVSTYYATVELITSLNENVASSKGIIVTASGKDNSFGTILTYDQKKQVLIITKIRQDDQLEVGDTIITSPYSTLYPQGIVIGKVLSRKISKEGLTYVAKVQPSADFDRLREVLVIDNSGD